MSLAGQVGSAVARLGGGGTFTVRDVILKMPIPQPHRYCVEGQVRKQLARLGYVPVDRTVKPYRYTLKG